jgi:hypothetical protein
MQALDTLLLPVRAMPRTCFVAKLQLFVASQMVPTSHLLLHPLISTRGVPGRPEISLPSADIITHSRRYPKLKPEIVFCLILTGAPLLLVHSMSDNGRVNDVSNPAHVMERAHPHNANVFSTNHALVVHRCKANILYI